MIETPKLDILAKDIDLEGVTTEKSWSAYRIRLIEDALLEVREILKTVRQKSLP